MSTKEFPDGWHVVDSDGTEFDGPYVERTDAERAAYAIDHRLEAALEG